MVYILYRKLMFAFTNMIIYKYMFGEFIKIYLLFFENSGYSYNTASVFFFLPNINFII